MLIVVFLDHQLVNDRKLGQTVLAVKAPLIGSSNATQMENLGPFDYVYLKVPFPEGFSGSEIHPHKTSAGPPSSYFLMVRLLQDLGGHLLTNW